MANVEVNIIEKTYEDPNPDIKMGAYLTRPSFYEALIHQQDDIKNVGYDWRPNLMKKSLSNYILANDDVEVVVTQYTKLLTYLVDTIQEIRKTINYAVDKKYKYIS
jgi:hypothetical protein